MSEDLNNQSQGFDTAFVQSLKDEIEILKRELSEAKEDKEAKKIKEVVSEELKQFKKEKLEYDLDQAHKIYVQATENERLANEERENRVLELRDAKVDRIKKDMVERIKNIKYLIDNKYYSQDYFSSIRNDSETQKMRDFYYHLYHSTDDVEKFVDDLFERYKRGKFSI